MFCQTRCPFFSRKRHAKSAKFKPTSSQRNSPDGFETTDFGEEKQSFALTASKGLMQSEEDLANVQLSEPVGGTMEHQGKEYVITLIQCQR